MIFEVAELQIDPGNAEAFEQAARGAVPLFRAAEGCTSFSLRRSIEHPGRYQLLVEWTSIAAHMEVFRNSEGYQAWRTLVGHFFTAPPVMQHLEEAVSGF